MDNQKFEVKPKNGDIGIDITVEEMTNMTHDEVSLFITDKLKVKKVNLFSDIIKILGIETTYKYFFQTLRIQLYGGMVIQVQVNEKNKKRYQLRTPGGVFLYLIKNDSTLSKETLDDILKLNKENSKAEKKRKIQIHKKMKWWNQLVRCWEVERSSGKTVPKSMQFMQAPVLDVCWSDDGTKVFMASCDETVKCWDLGSNQTMQIAQHQAPVKTCHFVKAPNYTCVMTTSWDKTIKFWDIRSPNPILTIPLPERSYCVDVEYPIAVVGTANRGIIIYQLETTPCEFKKMESPLKFQHRCVALFRDKRTSYGLFGFVLGSVEGRVAIQYINPVNPKDNFMFKCHRSNVTTNGCQDIYPVNDIKFHPVHGTLATVGSDGKYNFWDKNAKAKFKTSETMDQSITCCSFNSDGQIFAYAVSYDWSKGHEYHNPQKKNSIFLHPCFDDLKPR